MRNDECVIRAADMTSYQPAPGSKVRLITGDEHGLGISVGISEYPPGAETPAHRHSHTSAIVICEGRGVFTVGDDNVVAQTGDIVVVPPDAWHSFRNDGDSWLRLVGVDESSHPDTELAQSATTT